MRPAPTILGEAAAGDAWVAVFDERSAGDGVQRPTLRLVGGSTNPLLSRAQEGSRHVVFAGDLHVRCELQKRFGTSAQSDAAIVLAAYGQRGETMLDELRGVFALVLWDEAEGLLLAVRDQLGGYPLFVVQSDGRKLFSTSIDALLGIPGIRSDVSRAALVSILSSIHLRREATFFKAIERIPAGHRLRWQRGICRVSRYWDPAPPREPVQWAESEEIDRFDFLLEQAVARCQRHGKTGLYLSGGLDSASIAAVAAESSRRNGRPAPIALSLVFPHEECNEEILQRALAQRLGLEQVIVPLERVVPGGILRAALELSPRMPAPLLHLWSPGYHALAALARDRGCARILTGNGGDEWLSAGAAIAADLIWSLDFIGLYALWKMFDRSYPVGRLTMTRNLLWKSGLRLLLGEAAAAVLGRTAPGLLRAKRRRSLPIPAWLSSDPSLRMEIEENVEPPTPVADYGSFYMKQGRLSLDHFLDSLEMEEHFESARRGALPLLHPFFDVDLVALLYRTPPLVLARGNRSKAFVREMLERRFPGLGFERQRKIVARDYLLTLLRKQGKSAWEEFGRPAALTAAGIVDESALTLTVREALSDNGRADLHFLWPLLTGEAWLRARVG